MDNYINPETLSREDLSRLLEISRDKYLEFMDSLRDMQYILEESNKEFPYVLSDCKYAISNFEELWKDAVGDIASDIKSLYDEEELEESLNEEVIGTIDENGNIVIQEIQPMNPVIELSPNQDPKVMTGISNMLIDTLNKKYESISNFNSVKVTLDDENYSEMIPVIDSILEDETNHAGKLQELITLLSPQGDELESGKQEAVQILDNPLTESLNEANGKWYLSYYEEYPEYEPAEGGYYYACSELIGSQEFDSLEEAKAELNDMSKELKDEGFEKVDDTFYINRSKYIGEDRYYVIEEEEGSEERGPQIYQ